MATKAQSFWDKQAKKYDSCERQFDPVLRKVITRTKKHLDPDDNVLDFGCATGTKTLDLASVVHHIHGLDISAEMIRESIKKRDAAYITNCSFSQGTIFNDEFENYSFDKIISYAVIHLLEDCEGQIRRIHELLKPGGLFISTTGCFKDKMSLKTRFGLIISLFTRSVGIYPLYINMFRSADVVRIIENQNFQIVETEELFHEITAVLIIARKP